MKKVQLTNVNGNRIAKNTNQVKEQYIEKFLLGNGFEKGANGKYYLPIVIDDSTQKPAYICYDVSLSLVAPNETKAPKPRKSKEDDKKEVVLEDLF